jgi:hypothetical protein
MLAIAAVIALTVVGWSIAATGTKTKHVHHFCFSVDPRGGATMHDMDTSPNHTAPPSWRRVCVDGLRGKNGKQGERGTTGLNGPAGPAGPPGPPGSSTSTTTYTTTAVGDGTVTAVCRAGDKAVSGGFADTDPDEWVAASFKTADGRGWTIKESKANTDDSPTAVTAYAYCQATS